MRAVGKVVMAGFLAAACATAVAATQSEFVTRTGVHVTPIDDAVFEVAMRPGSVRTDFWCGAGEFAYHRLGASLGAPIYAVSNVGQGVARASPDAVQFSLTQPDQLEVDQNKRKWWKFWAPGVGDSQTVRDARLRCNVDRENFLY